MIFGGVSAELRCLSRLAHAGLAAAGCCAAAAAAGPDSMLGVAHACRRALALGLRELNLVSLRCGCGIGAPQTGR